MKLLLCSDTHLSRCIWKDRPEIYGDSYVALSAIQQLAKHHSVDHVIMAGDIFDTRFPSSEDVWHFVRFAQALWQAGIGLYCIQGQHDEAHPCWASALHPHAVDLEAHPLVTQWGVIYGLHYHRRKELLEAVRSLDSNCLMLVAHQLWNELLGIGPIGGDLSVTEISHASVLYSGDMHQANMVTSCNAQGQELIAFSTGATHLRRLNEPTQHFVALMSLDSGDIEMLELPSRPIVFAEYPGEVTEEWVSQLESHLDAALQKSDPQAFDGLSDGKPIVVVQLPVGLRAGQFESLSEWSSTFIRAHVIRQTRSVSQQRQEESVSLEALGDLRSNHRHIAQQVIERYFEKTGGTSVPEDLVRNGIRLALSGLSGKDSAVKTLEELRKHYLDGKEVS